jgi:hypothetical protein
MTTKDNWWSGHQSLKEGVVTTMPADTPTIVFVHGAWADASGFGGSIRALSDRAVVSGAISPCNVRVHALS